MINKIIIRLRSQIIDLSFLLLKPNAVELKIVLSDTFQTNLIFENVEKV